MNGGVGVLSKNEAVIRDMRRSMTYVNIAKPIISKLLGGGCVLPVEGSDNEVCKMLDATCGTDYFQVYDSLGLVYGVASRVQYTKNYRSFTIRNARAGGAMTEFEKRKLAIARGGVYPKLTMQMYVDGETISGIGIAKTADLISFVEAGLARERKTGVDQVGQATFYVAFWDEMIRAGIKVLEYKAG